MALRCLVFTSDEGTAAPIRQILADLGVESDPCSDAVASVEKITNQNFQIVIIDWDKQPEAGLLLTTARERKASERALTLAIVSDDASVPGVLQAGANSILRKPISIHQATDTLTTARDLLRAKHDSATGGSHSAAAAAAATGSLVPKLEQKEATLRAGEFQVTTPVKPGAQFETESEFPLPPAQSSAIPLDPLKDLEPVASSVAHKAPEPSGPTAAAPTGGETHGLEWYLKTRVASRSNSPAASEPPKPAGNPELLGYDQISTPSSAGKKSPIEPAAAPKPNPPAPEPLKLAKKRNPKRDEYRNDEERKDEGRKEAELFAYIDGERTQQSSASRFHLGKRPIFVALLLASIAVAATPQAPWHSSLRALWHSGQKQVRAWLNPQPVTAVQEAPPAHEALYRPGDEYKLPVAENIPDATTDPSQIEVLPAVDPTAKKPNPDATNPGQTATPADGSLPVDQTPPQTPESPDVKPTQITTGPVAAQPVAASPAASQPTVTVASLPPHAGSASVVSAPVTPIAKPAPQPHYGSIPGSVPPSLRSQLAPATPDPVSKPADTALPSIEPVTVAESAERALLADQPPIPYPANAKRQQGTVVLQVFIGRDGTVQDAKFLQGSFLFARTAIDGVQQWKFKPYILNGRPVSVQTTLTMKFKPSE